MKAVAAKLTYSLIIFSGDCMLVNPCGGFFHFLLPQIFLDSTGWLVFNASRSDP